MKYLLSLSLVLVFGQTFGQFVPIPDYNFKTYLKVKYPACFNSNDWMDTTCTEIVQERNLIIPNLDIFELEGVQYFDGLIGLYCYDNRITLLSKLPQSLNALVCSRNKISHLPNIPESVTYLACNSNLIKTLPKLPSKLSSLICDSNQLYALPTLPESLVNLTCNQNTLKKMPVLPANLSYLMANNNCFLEVPINPNPNVLTSFNVSPNRADCGIYAYLEKVTDDKYLVSYNKTNGVDNGVSFLEYRCGSGYGTAELAAIADAHKRFTEFDDYKIKNLKRGIIKTNIVEDTVTYNETKYYLGDTIKLPKLDTLIISTDNRITGDDVQNANLRGNSHFFIQIATANNSELNDYMISTIEVPTKNIRYASRLISDYLYYFPNKQNQTITKPNSKQQILANFYLYSKDTTFQFNNISFSCTNYLISSIVLKRRVEFVLSRVDTLSLTIQEGLAQLKKLKLVYAQYNGNVPISNRTYTVFDSVTSFANNKVKMTNKSIDKNFMKMNSGDSIHYQLIAEFDTVQKPVIFQSNNISFQTSMAKKVYKVYSDNYNSYLDSTIVSNSTIFSKSLTICGNYKVKARIVGDTVHCQNTSKTFTANVNPNDKSIGYSWKYGTSFSSSPNFKVTFPTLGTRNMELTLTSKCGTDKAIQPMQTIATPAKPIVSQVNNVLTSSASTGNQWYKDNKLLTDETNRSITVSSGGKYKVTVSNLCGSNTSNEISVILTENESAMIDEALHLYPNPASSQLFLTGSVEDCLAEIIHPNGTVMMSKNMSDKTQIDIAELPTGMYFFRLFDRQKNLKLTQKFLKN